MPKAIDLVNAELLNALGNLLSRCTVTKLNPYQQYPQLSNDELQSTLKDDGKRLIDSLNSLIGIILSFINISDFSSDNVSECYETLYFYRGLELIFNQIRETNAFLEVHRPWNMSPSPEVSIIISSPFSSYFIL